VSQTIDQARAELEAAQSALDTALRAWDESVSELWRTSLRLTEAQKRVTRATSFFGKPLPIRRPTHRLTALPDPPVGAYAHDLSREGKGAIRPATKEEAQRAGDGWASGTLTQHGAEMRSLQGYAPMRSHNAGEPTLVPWGGG
jgi:hypothetical protein